MTSNDPGPQTVHHPARYRVNEHGAHVVLVPTHCPSRRHVLTTSGYRIVETGDTLNVTCHQCTSESRTGPSWALATGGRQAESAEFDDTLYADLLSEPIR